MSQTRGDRLYNLLPALYRKLDEQQREPLRALMAVLQSELDLFEDDVQAQYDNWFIETCDRWVIPYIADLVGVDGLKDPQQLFSGQRRRVANSLRYRRRKGTVVILEHVLRDVTDWPAHVVEYYRRTAMTQHVGYPRPDAGKTLDVRDRQALVALGSPFDGSARTGDLRAIASTDRHHKRGRYDLPNVGLFLWRLHPYPIAYSPAHYLKNEPDEPALYTFDPLGRDTPLYNNPMPVLDELKSATIGHLPIPLTQTLMAADLSAYSAQPPYKRTGNSTFYGLDRGLSIEYWAYNPEDGLTERRTVPPEEVLSLSLWEGLQGLDVPAGKTVAIDVERGRFAFLTNNRPKPDTRPIVSYTYAFSADIGGGPYERKMPVHSDQLDVLHVYVAKGLASDTFEELPKQWQETGPWKAQTHSLVKALELWEKFYAFQVNQSKQPAPWPSNSDRQKEGQAFQVRQSRQQAPRPTCIIHILDNGVYGGRNDGNNLKVLLPRGSRLSIVAAVGVRPTLRPLHALVFSGNAISTEVTAESMASERQLNLNGLFIDRQVIVPPPPFFGRLSIDFDHCTLMPGGMAVETTQPVAKQIRLHFHHSLVGPLRFSTALDQLVVSDSIIDGLAESAIIVGDPGPVGQTILERVTILGAAQLHSLTRAQDCLFTGPVTVKEIQPGEVVRTSYLAPDSNIPSLEQSFKEPKVKPIFTSTTFGNPAYGQLSPENPSAILRGASNGSMLGAFCHLDEPQRAANIQAILDEYLPFGLEVGVFYVT